ncbi:MAG TPA: propionyl-CoA synthetase, partial [Rhodospirillaceae bacterium]|nr:propionyl-CoA synthetase [Rhodospirillaceae bacterium]
IKDCRPKAILTASCGLEPGRIVGYQKLIEGALTLAPDIVDSVLVFKREEAAWDLKSGRDHDWDEALAAAT